MKFSQPKLFANPESNILRKPWFLIVVAIVVVVLAVLIIYPIYAVANSQFFRGYSSHKSSYSAWLKSSHKDVRCVDCHRKPGFINGIVFKTKSVTEFYRKSFVGAKESTLLKKPSKEACQSCHERPATMLRAVSLKIPHRAHQDLGQIETSCANCHKWLVHNEAYETKHKKLPLSAVCLNYACHVGTQAKDSCSTCHHQATIAETQWSEVHRENVDKYGQNGCFDYCHNVSYCQTCHTTGQKPTNGVTAGTAIQPGDLISKHTNSPDWIKGHGGEALNDEAKCLNCHMAIQYCDSCHKKRPASHGRERQWITVHKKLAKDNEKACLTCHEKKMCDECHELFKEKGL